MPRNSEPTTRNLLALFILSAVLLAQQIWLTRMIALQHWHHLAPLVIAIALLGFGAAGVFVSLRAQQMAHNRWMVASAIMAALSAALGIILAARIPLNMLALPWQIHQVGLLAVYALCLLPVFFFGAVFVSLCFVRWPGRAGRVYAADLAGGAFGALMVLPLVDAVGLAVAMLVLVLAALAAGLLLAATARGRGLIVLLVLGALAAHPLVELTPADYKAQSQRQLERGSRVLLQEDGLSRRFTVLESPGMHAAPGLSLGSKHRAPRQWQWFSDGDTPVPLLRTPTPPPDLFRAVLGYAPYHLTSDIKRVSILDAKALWHTWVAAAAGAENIALITADAEIIEFLTRLKRREPDGIYPNGLTLLHAAPRRYLSAETSSRDLIVLAVHSPEAGIAATQENYLLTWQAFTQAFKRLSADGVLAIEVALHSIPRDTLRLVAMVTDVLRHHGLNSADHVAVLRDWRTALVMVRHSAIDAKAATQLGHWATAHQFDRVALPGLAAADSNRFHHLEESYFEPVQALLSNSARLRDYLFGLSPPTDNQPFFFRFFRWQSVAQWTDNSLWRQHLDWGYLLALCALVVGTLTAVFLLTLPRLFGERAVHPRWAQAYFLGIGLGFMLAEIALLHKAALLLDATALSMSAVLAAMLAGAGLGSYWQQMRPPSNRAMIRLFIVIAVLVLLILPLLDALFELSAPWPLPLRTSLVVGLIAAMSLPMGIPLPQAIVRLQNAPPATIARMWAINGFASVVASLGAGLIAIHIGLFAVMVFAALCYLVAAWCFLYHWYQ